MAARSHPGNNTADGHSHRQHRGLPRQRGLITMVARLPRRPSQPRPAPAGNGNHPRPPTGHHRGRSPTTHGRCGKIIPDQRRDPRDDRTPGHPTRAGSACGRNRAIPADRHQQPGRPGRPGGHRRQRGTRPTPQPRRTHPRIRRRTQHGRRQQPTGPARRRLCLTQSRRTRIGRRRATGRRPATRPAGTALRRAAQRTGAAASGCRAREHDRLPD